MVWGGRGPSLGGSPPWCAHGVPQGSTYDTPSIDQVFMDGCGVRYLDAWEEHHFYTSNHQSIVSIAILYL